MSIEVVFEAIKDSSFTVMLTVVAGAVLSNVLVSQIIKPERRDEKAKDKLFKLLNSHIDAGHDIDLDFLKYVKASVEREFQTNIAISHLLEDFLVHKLGTQSDNSINIDKLKFLIEAEKQVKPFDSLPSEERRLLKGIKDSIEAKEAAESAYYFIDELSTVLSVRSSEYNRSHQTNKWSVPLAIIGLVFTILFGIMSIFSGPDEDVVASKIIERIEQQSPNNQNQPDS